MDESENGRFGALGRFERIGSKFELPRAVRAMEETVKKVRGPLHEDKLRSHGVALAKDRAVLAGARLLAEWPPGMERIVGRAAKRTWAGASEALADHLVERLAANAKFRQRFAAMRSLEIAEATHLAIERLSVNAIRSTGLQRGPNVALIRRIASAAQAVEELALLQEPLAEVQQTISDEHLGVLEKADRFRAILDKFKGAALDGGTLVVDVANEALIVLLLTLLINTVLGSPDGMRDFQVSLERAVNDRVREIREENRDAAQNLVLKELHREIIALASDNWTTFKTDAQVKDSKKSSSDSRGSASAGSQALVIKIEKRRALIETKSNKGKTIMGWVKKKSLNRPRDPMFTSESK